MLFNLRPDLEGLFFEEEGELPARRVLEPDFATQLLMQNLQIPLDCEPLLSTYENQGTPLLHTLLVSI